jgi:RNA polymerase sigma-32 factor
MVGALDLHAKPVLRKRYVVTPGSGPLARSRNKNRGKTIDVSFADRGTWLAVRARMLELQTDPADRSPFHPKQGDRPRRARIEQSGRLHVVRSSNDLDSDSADGWQDLQELQQLDNGIHSSSTTPRQAHGDTHGDNGAPASWVDASGGLAESDANPNMGMVLPLPSKAESTTAVPLGPYMTQLRRFPVMSRRQEHEMAVAFARTGDSRLAAQLVTANLRLVVKIAGEYGRNRRDLPDLIQEGNMGLVRAVEKYDPHRGVKLSSYAAWWIRAYILKFILANWRLVKVGTTQAQRKLFFNLNKRREKLERNGEHVDAKRIAAELGVSEQQVTEMEKRLSAEASLDTPIRSDGNHGHTTGDTLPAPASQRPDAQVELGEFTTILRSKLETFKGTLAARDLEIFQRRLLNDERVTSVQMAHRYGISPQRVRQLEDRLRKKVRQFLEDELGDAVRCAS